LAFALGFYDGFFGPGTGSFLAFGFILLFRFGFLRATAHAKLLNLASNYAAILAFVLGGEMYWVIALPMGLANIAGPGRVPAWPSVVDLVSSSLYSVWCFSPCL
jgi:uncharacterized protein